MLATVFPRWNLNEESTYRNNQTWTRNEEDEKISKASKGENASSDCVPKVDECLYNQLKEPLKEEDAPVEVDEYLPNPLEEPSNNWDLGLDWNALDVFVQHSLALRGLSLLPWASLPSLGLFLFLLPLSGLGASAGVHRLWCHRTYKAKLPLRLFLMACFSLTNMGSVYSWCMDHRVHHKYSETAADPYDSRRGIFFSHIGWLLLRRHPENMKKSQAFRMFDLEQDWMVMLENRFYLPICILFAYILPSLIPYFLWGEDLTTAFFICCLRCTIINHCVSLINSYGHVAGMKPYDKNIMPCDNRLVALLTNGDGFHNYHHAFPYDYRTSEWGLSWNLSTGFIDLMACLGLAYERKIASEEVIAGRANRTGDPELTMAACLRNREKDI